MIFFFSFETKSNRQNGLDGRNFLSWGGKQLFTIFKKKENPIKNTNADSQNLDQKLTLEAPNSEKHEKEPS